jgi:hypothetical protein
VEPGDLPAYRDAGVDQLVLPAFAADAQKVSELLGRLSERFVERAQTL